MGLGGIILARAPLMTLARVASLALPRFRNPRYPCTPVDPRSEIPSGRNSTERRAAARGVSCCFNSVSRGTNAPFPSGQKRAVKPMDYVGSFLVRCWYALCVGHRYVREESAREFWFLRVSAKTRR